MILGNIVIKKLNHVAIAVPDMAKAIAQYKNQLGAEVSEPKDLPDHGVTTVFVNVGNTVIELLHPLGDNSPIANFLLKNPNGAMHHLCYEVEDIKLAAAKLEADGCRALGDIKIGAHGKPVLFMHPKDFSGTLIELEEV